jgi:hypothetical protein
MHPDEETKNWYDLLDTVGLIQQKVNAIADDAQTTNAHLGEILATLREILTTLKYSSSSRTI